MGPQSSLNSLDHDREKERLPSIVVEPTEVSEVESGELRWPPENIDMEDDEEDLFLEQCIPPANIADWGDEEEEETSVILNQQPSLTLIGELDTLTFLLIYTSSYFYSDLFWIEAISFVELKAMIGEELGNYGQTRNKIWNNPKS